MNSQGKSTCVVVLGKSSKRNYSRTHGKLTCGGRVKIAINHIPLEKGMSVTKCKRCELMDIWWSIPDQSVLPSTSALASLDRINRYVDHCIISLDYQLEALADDFKEIQVEIDFLDKSIGCI